MYLLLDDIINDEIKEYLLTQVGINNVKLKKENFKTEINIAYDSNISPLIIMKYIDLFTQSNLPLLLEFNKVLKTKNKKLKYIVNDMCCEYCYKSLIKNLFENEFINSVKSNFDTYCSAFNIELEIEYTHYTENELIEIIKLNL